MTDRKPRKANRRTGGAISARTVSKRGRNMENLRERLERGVAILDRLDRRRQETKSPLWGYNTEYLVIARELRQLEADLVS